MGVGHRRTSSVSLVLRRNRAGRRVIRIGGELLSDVAADLSQLVTAELTRSSTPLIIDVSEVTAADAAGINVLVLAASLANESDIALYVTGVQEGAVANALVDFGLVDAFEIGELIGVA